MEFVRRLTEHALTPDTFETAFSTLALQAAQLIPVTVYCSIPSSPFYSYYVPNFQTSVTSSAFSVY
jgi:hypothetical protein